MTDHDLIDQERPLIGGHNAGSVKDHALIVRDERFCRSNRPSRWWLGGDPIGTAWYNSVSATLPRGEAFFVESIKAFRDEVPPKLAAEMRDFVRQEVNHSREHIAFNRYVEDHGYDMTGIDRRLGELLSRAAGRPREIKLAVSLAYEHLAATLSDQLLRNSRHLAKAEHEPAELWRWHSAEEIEHKGVVYDIWVYATRDWSAGKRWRTRAMLTAILSRNFVRNRISDALDLLAQDGITGWNAKRRLYTFLWWSPGILRRMFPEWVAILFPGFHPWNKDNSDLVQRYRRPDIAPEQDRSPVGA